jgi:superfamily I DNA/RNA helicase/DNA polymerase III epsilon subunit-like protein
VLVLAGPGAGKTFCLISRIEFLISRLGFDPERICAVTFTNKAAEEIDGRLKAAIGFRASDVTRGTLHSLCASVLREWGHKIGLPRSFGIADEDYQLQLVRRLRVRPERQRKLLTLFGRRRLENYPLTPGDERLFSRYVEALREQCMIDFDDLIFLTARLLEESPDAAQELASRWDYLLVDEFQDLDPAQYSIIRRLAEGHRNIFAVGDDEQSIFSWRGAHPDLLKTFQRDFGIDGPVVLDRNHRCSRQIFDAARRLAEVNPQLFSKGITADRQSDHSVRAYLFPDEKGEAEWIVSDIQADRRQSGLEWGDYAVLFKTHEMGRELEQRFVRAGIPCRMARHRALSDDRVIGWVTAALRVLLNPRDDTAVEAWAAKMLPAALIERIRSEAARRKLSFAAAVRHYARNAQRQSPEAKHAWRFLYQLGNLEAIYRSHQTLKGLVSDLLLQRTGVYRNRLEEAYTHLSDPAADLPAVALCEKLEAALARDGRIWLEPMGGLGIALQGLAFNAGLASARLLESKADPGPGDVVVGSADAGPLGLPITLFKALQLLHTRTPGEGLKDYVAFDLETTDRDPESCGIVELAAVRVRDGCVVDRFHSSVRPEVPISAQAKKLHGCSEEDLAGAPDFAAVWPRFRAFVGSDLLVAHNAHGFDAPVLRRAAENCGGADDLVFFDTIPLARSLIRGSVRLEDLALHFGIDKGRAHRALDDAITLAAVVRELERLKNERARKAALSNLLDYLALALVLDGVARDSGGEPALLLELGAPYALGRYSDCLEVYAQERERLGLEEAPPLDRVIEALGGRQLMERLRAEPDPARRYPEAVARLEGLIEASAGDTLEESIRQFLTLVALSTSEGAGAAPRRVNLLTLHSTKGLEFSRVYIVGVEDALLPGWRALAEDRRAEIEEARRLLYVGMTRAKDRLVLTRARVRKGRDAGGNKFLDEIGLTPIEMS